MPDTSLTQLGALGIILIFTIKELFSYLKSRKDGGETTEGAILYELKTMNNNHLHTIQDVLEVGNNRLIDVIHADNTRIIELLAEIKGGLNQKK